MGEYALWRADFKDFLRELRAFEKRVTSSPLIPTLEDIEIIYPGRANKGMAYIPLSRLSAVPENEREDPEFTMFEELPAWGLYVRHVTGLSLKNICLRLKNDDFRPAYVFDDVQDLDMDDINIPIFLKEPQVVLQDVRHANVNIGDKNIVQTLKRCSDIQGL